MVKGRWEGVVEGRSEGVVEGRGCKGGGDEERRYMHLVGGNEKIVKTKRLEEELGRRGERRKGRRRE